MHTITIDVLNDKVLTLLRNLEALELIQFHNDEQTDIPQWQQEESERRMQRIRSGQDKAIPIEETFAKLDQLKKQRGIA